MKTWIKALGLTMLIAATPATPVFAQDDDDNSDVGELIITAARIRQGGAQDISFFRNEAAAMRVPMPASLTPEGLLGGYNLVLGPQPPCPQLFCLTGEAMKADLALKPDDAVFVGLGFASNIDADKWSREPVNLVAVVDKSGSMEGQPLALVRRSLKTIVRQMRPGDQITIVLYGDESHRYMAPTAITRTNVPDILARIDRIESAGSTNMEEGLRVGYDAAFETQAAFKGTTRVMLFTDEQPNVGATDADSFMGMAKAASVRRIGLTTIGVGVQFDAALATDISSVRGGNLFFMANEQEVDSVFAAKLDYMVSEVAHDITMTVAPAPGYRITAVYGVPGEMLTWRGEDQVSFTVPTVFLSQEGGGIFVTLARAEPNMPAPRLAAGQALTRVDLTYVDAKTGATGAHRMSIPGLAARPGQDLVLGQTLMDEFLLLREGSARFHAGDDEGAYNMFRQLSARLDQANDPRLKPERELAQRLYGQTAFLSGHSAEPPKAMSALELFGDWRVVGVRGDVGLKKGDRLQLGTDNLATVLNMAGGEEATEDPEPFRARGNRLTLPESQISFRYRLDGESLTLNHRETGATVTLAREGKPSAEEIRAIGNEDAD